MVIDFNSLSPFWLVVDHNNMITSCCDYFSTYKNKDIKECIIFHQPAVKLKTSLALQLMGKLVLYTLVGNEMRYRANVIKYGEHIVFISWPLIDKLENLIKSGLSNMLNHPASQQVDILIIKDILKKSQEKIYEIEIREIEEKLEYQKKISERQSKLASLGEVAAGIGHEINNPLSICAGNINLIFKLLQKKDINRDDILQRLKKVTDSNERIRKIVDGMSIFSRTNSERLEPISINNAITSTLLLIEELYSKDSVSIIKKYSEKIFLTEGIKGKFQQVFMNLLSNAKDATVGQKHREITIDLQQKDESYFIFSVKDNGSGMSEEVKARALEPFFTTKAEGVGTGIGLGVVAGYVKEMNGRIEIQSGVGKGCAFLIELPYAKRKEKQINQHEDSSQQKLLKGVALVVDDEEGIREILVEYLVGMGLTVDEAEDGDIALEMVKKKKYNYICTDMKMPRMSGEKFIKEARKLPNGDTNIFIITGGASGNILDLESISNGSISKPFMEEDIYALFSKEPLKQ
jgi:signal transduction histidine kinase/CheY-like chemotaxis protein